MDYSNISNVNKNVNNYGNVPSQIYEGFPMMDLAQYGTPIAVLPPPNNAPLNVYNEVTDINLYSEVPQEPILRPHRPAPPQPLIDGLFTYPQSAQQLQRKLSQAIAAGAIPSSPNIPPAQQSKLVVVTQLQQEMPGAVHDECVAALQACGWDFIGALKQLKIQKLVK